MEEPKVATPVDEKSPESDLGGAAPKEEEGMFFHSFFFSLSTLPGSDSWLMPILLNNHWSSLKMVEC